jgi:hypothetical protein
MEIKNKDLASFLGLDINSLDNIFQVEFNDFSDSSIVKGKIQSVDNIRNQIMKIWEERAIILDITRDNFVIPNGMENSAYHHKFDKEYFSSRRIKAHKFTGLKELGLRYDEELRQIDGKPNSNGDLNILLHYQVEGQTTDVYHEKPIRFVINADPKSLWKDLPSDKDDKFWKKDNDSIITTIGERKVVISSKRGRSHQNVGSFRDDHFAIKFFERTGWTAVVVSDGAGSSPFSRKGSQVACDGIIEYLEQTKSYRDILQFDNLIRDHDKTSDKVKKDDILTDATSLSKKFLYKAVIHSFNRIKEIAEETKSLYPEDFTNNKLKSDIEYFHSTLIFTVFKKFDSGYIILTFSVGDCPISVVDETNNYSKLLNYLDVGQFGGGTRFLTQTEIFHSAERPIADRFNLYYEKNFSHLFLMSDGIYDPKFEVEANLEKTDIWLNFIKDLKGENEDNCSIDFTKEDSEIECNLNQWMDFWNKGNHDDRTLAIIF